MRCYCGGRGSSSSGGGRFGKGGGRGVEILSTTSMVSAREGKGAEVDQALQVARDIQNQYGINVEDLQIATLGGKDQGTMAYYDANGNLAYNESYFDAQKMNGVYDATVNSGFHPSRGNKTGIEAVVSHEMGHAFADVFCNGSKASKESQAIVNVMNSYFK